MARSKASRTKFAANKYRKKYRRETRKRAALKGKRKNLYG